MIAKLNKGRGFRGALEYSLRESKGFLLDTNMGGSTPRALAREFGQIRALRPELTRPVHHASIALPPGESLSNEQWQAIGRAYLEGMGFTNNQYIIARHTDAGHAHIHVLVNRIGMDGKLVSDSKDYQRQEQIMRQLEHEYGLTPVAPSKESVRRAATKGELECALRTGKASGRMLLQKLVDAALQEASAYAGFCACLEAAGVRVKPNQASTGRISGISFEYNGITMKGSDLGRGYTWVGLQKRGLYEQIRYNGRDTGRGNTPERTGSEGKRAHTAANGATDRPAYGADSAGDRTAGEGSVINEYQCGAGVQNPASGMPIHASFYSQGAGKNRRGDEAGEGKSHSGGRSCLSESGRDAECRSIDAGGFQSYGGAQAENAAAHRQMEMGIPTDDGGVSQSALGRVVALAVAELRQHNPESDADTAQAGCPEHGSRDIKERARSAEAIAPQPTRHREDRER